MWYIYPVEYYSAVKRNGLLTHAKTPTNLEDIMLKKKPNTERHVVCDSIYVKCLTQANP